MMLCAVEMNEICQVEGRIAESDSSKSRGQEEEERRFWEEGEELQIAYVRRLRKEEREISRWCVFGESKEVRVLRRWFLLRRLAAYASTCPSSWE